MRALEAAVDPLTDNDAFPFAKTILMSDSSLPPRAERHLEDYVPGAVHLYGPIHFTETDILEFARRYDPQFFHIDAEAAARGPYKGLIASGWHTTSATMRLLVDQFLSSTASLGSPGIDELRWKLPVRPGDALRVRVTIREATPSRSKPDRGLMRSLIEVINQSDQVVLSMLAMNLMLRRPGPAEASKPAEGENRHDGGRQRSDH